jgi:hypothetical protein
MRDHSDVGLLSLLCLSILAFAASGVSLEQAVGQSSPGIVISSSVPVEGFP